LTSAGTIIQQTDITCKMFFQTTSSCNFYGNGNTLTVSNGVISTIYISAGSTDSMIITQQGSGAFYCNGGNASIGSFTCAINAEDVCTQVQGTCWVRKLAIGAGTFAMSTLSTSIYQYPIVSNDFLTIAAGGQITTAGSGNSMYWYAYSDCTLNGVSLPCHLIARGQNGRTITMTGDLTLAAGKNFTILGTTANNKSLFAMAGYDLTCNTITLGDAANANREATLLLGSGTHSIDSITRSNAGDDENAVNFGTSTTTLSGAIDGTGIVFTNTSGRILGGTVTNVNCNATNPLNVWGTIESTGNASIRRMRAVVYHHRRAA